MKKYNSFFNMFFILLLVFCSVTNAKSQTNENNYYVFTDDYLTNSTCRDWIRSRALAKDSNQVSQIYVLQKVWITGYQSGLNTIIKNGGLSNKVWPVDSDFNFIDDICIKNMNIKLADVLVSYAQDFLQKNK
ncbi:MAG: hypothetical protein AB7U41_01225 [Dongiaceae bacterium]